MYESLTKPEAKRLARFLREKQGNIKKATEITGLAIGTVKRAAAGLEITIESKKAITKHLLN